MKFTKVRNVKTPTRANSQDAGIDFFVPEFDDKFVKDLLDKNKLNTNLLNISDNDLFITLQPQERILIPSGIHVNFIEEANELRTKLNNPKIGLSLNANNKSGVGSKLGLDTLACIVDETYMGEVHINLVNTGNEEVKITPNQKIVQFLLSPVLYCNVEEVNKLDDLYTTQSSRGEGGFGHTDNK